MVKSKIAGKGRDARPNCSTILKTVKGRVPPIRSSRSGTVRFRDVAVLHEQISEVKVLTGSKRRDSCLLTS